MTQLRLAEEDKDKDEFVQSLNLTPEKIRKDMESMKGVEGFPIGDDDDILNLSNPPYYTAYPNPYIKAFIEKYGKPYDEATDDYHREPFVGDVSEGKNDPIYNAHSYHTKVPHKAIMKFIEHYTEPGDIVFDGFCGSGMTGLASQSLKRKAVISDISTTATFISSFYNLPINAFELRNKLITLSKEVQSEVAWMYETKHNDKIQGIIEFVVWSDVFICPFCKNEYTLYDVAVDDDSGSVNIEYKCYHCGSNINKEKSSRAVIRKFDQAIKQEISVTKQLPVLINYKVGNKRYEKKPDGLDDDILNKIDVIEIPYWYPTDRMPVGDESRRNDKIGITHIHHFFTKRSLYVLSCIRQKLLEYRLPLFILSILLTNCSNMGRYGKRTGNVSGTLYIPSLIKELNVLEYLERKLYGPKGIINPLTKTQIICRNKEALISTQSLTNLGNIPDSTFDYIFTDPPFGENLMYSELNFITEAWLKVFTNNGQEAIINKSQAKDIDSYAKLMLDCFKECFRVLKPNRWITIEFHNSKAEIWKTIQEAIVKAGFIIGQVAVLDKKQGSFKQVTAPGTVKNDLVINAYKPSKKFAETFLNKAGLNMEQDFMDMHLDKMPIEPNVERTQQMLYSKLLAQYIQNGFEVRMDAMEFYSMLGTYFVERDGYWFKQEQIPEYEKRLKLAKNIGKADLNQLLLFVSDEKSTIIWLSQFLREPRTYSEIYTEWTQKWNERQDKMPELRDILEENFVTESGKWRLPSIGEKKEKEELRERRLAREFQDILEEAQSEKKVSSVRKEALLHGLMKLYNERNVNIINLLGKRLDKRIIESDDDIYAIIDWASSKGD